jgi:hypothetical protein
MDITSCVYAIVDQYIGVKGYHHFAQVSMVPLGALNGRAGTPGTMVTYGKSKDLP